MRLLFLNYNNIINSKSIIGSAIYKFDFSPIKPLSARILAAIIFLFAASNSFANNLTISNVSLANRNPSSNTVVVEFDVSWENSWRTKINHDAIWLTARLYNPTASPTDKMLCQMSASGTNPTGTSSGSNALLEVYVPSDKLGVFLRPSDYGNSSSVVSSNVQLTVKYDSCGFADADIVNATVMGIEMVYVPEGSFYAGDGAGSSAAFVQGSADNDSWVISSESAVSVANPANNGYRYVSSGQPDENATGSSFSISADFPKGYGAFYAMKYEITESQWVEFINSLPSQAARSNHDLTDSLHKNTDTVKFRNTINCSGSPLSCSSSRDARALNYLSWRDLVAFFDWAALRPMTELEFEKMSRGPLVPVSGEFVWGSTEIAQATTLSGSDEDGSETITDSGVNAHYNNAALSGGDSGNGADYQKGALRSGIFAEVSSTREQAGAGYYGVMDLSGNLRERVVTVGNATGRSFVGSHGDGVLSTDSGYEGNANQTDWPGIDAITTRGVTGALGSGFKGGGWDEAADRLRISDRGQAATTDTSAYSNAGGRGVRTYDGE
jgi:formylglycine-generating enzyme required for sulfatase activity